MSLDLGQPVRQEAFGALVGISQQAVSDLVMRGLLARDGTCGAWLLAYCANLREQAAGRAANGDLDLAAERALLAREQRIAQARKNALDRGELAPVDMIETVIARVGRQIAGVLEAVPVELRRRDPGLTAESLAFVEGELTRARNLAAEMTLEFVDELVDEDDDDDADAPGQTGDQVGA